MYKVGNTHKSIKHHGANTLPQNLYNGLFDTAVVSIAGLGFEAMTFNFFIRQCEKILENRQHKSF